MRARVLCIVAVLLAAAAAEASSVRELYLRLLKQEQTVRAALDREPAPATALAEARRVAGSYERLVARYPTSPYSDNALYQAAMLRGQAYARFRVEEDRASAVRLLRRLPAEYPSSSLVARARPAVTRLEAEVAPTRAEAAPRRPEAVTTGEATAPVSAAASTPPPPSPAVPKAAVSAPGASARVIDVRRTLLPEVVRVTIELDREVEFRDEQIAHPSRVFVDLRGVAGVESAAPLSYSDQVVRAIRVGQPAADVTRVVLDLTQPTRHSVFTLYNPFRIVVDCERPAGAASPVAEHAPAAGAAPARLAEAPVVPPSPAATVPAAALPPTSSGKGPLPIPEDAVRAPAKTRASTAATSAPLPPAPDPPGAPLTASPTITSADLPMPAPTVPSANLQGGFSLSRQLGLGVGRVVVDPGHGGRDPGARKSSLTEAELVLDVALRLEQLLAKEPGVEVVLTRRSDVYVPLEERTAIANRETADLFLSIHANASRNQSARGVETYFLNFASTPDAEAVAARENSASERAMHQLPDIVRAITLNNKLDESRDFATMVQRALIEQLRPANKSLRDLGVKQAPFVVLIGAGMPSVLAEISFLTNQQEGRLLKTPAYRQRIAEALARAIMRYQRSLKTVRTVATQQRP